MGLDLPARLNHGLGDYADYTRIVRPIFCGGGQAFSFRVGYLDRIFSLRRVVSDHRRMDCIEDKKLKS